jgi:uncharacterized membrane-anchored protein
VYRIRLLAGALTLGFALSVSYAHAQMSDQAIAQFRALSWQPVKDIVLPYSKAKLTGLSDYAVVTGSDANRARQLADGVTQSGLEAEIINPTTGQEAIFQYQASGFVSLDDWSQIDPTQFLEEVKKNTEAANEKRWVAGLPGLHATGWLQRPTLNQDTHTVSWSIEASGDNGEKIINAIALKLGRYGYEKITYIVGADAIRTAPQILFLIANAHQFPSGTAYTDYVAGADHAAEYGIAGLVAGVLGVKVLKVAAGSGLALFAKKLGWLLILPVVWVWRKVRSQKEPTVPSIRSIVPK